MSTRPYKDEFLIHPTEREVLPRYLLDPIDRLHTHLSVGDPWSCDISINQNPHLYAVRISPSTLTVSTSLNGETDTVVHNPAEFDRRGGIGDRLRTMSEAGALPPNAEPSDISTNEG